MLPLQKCEEAPRSSEEPHHTFITATTTVASLLRQLAGGPFKKLGFILDCLCIIPVALSV